MLRHLIIEPRKNIHTPEDVTALILKVTTGHEPKTFTSTVHLHNLPVSATVLNGIFSPLSLPSYFDTKIFCAFLIPFYGAAYIVHQALDTRCQFSRHVDILYWPRSLSLRNTFYPHLTAYVCTPTSDWLLLGGGKVVQRAALLREPVSVRSVRSR